MSGVSRREKLERMLADEPKDLFLNYALAMELAKGEETAAALTRFDQVLAVDPTYTAAYYQKGSLLSSIGRREEASDVLRAGLAAAQRQGDAHAASEMQELLTRLHA